MEQVLISLATNAPAAVAALVGVKLGLNGTKSAVKEINTRVKQIESRLDGMERKLWSLTGLNE